MFNKINNYTYWYNFLVSRRWRIVAKEQQLSISAHPSIYEPIERKMNIYFSEPEQGVKHDTGILLLIAGYGGNANSNVYKKMRNQFADQYNLITVQCDYFGWQFMQSDNLDLKEEFTENEIKDIFTSTEIESIRLDIQKLIPTCSLYNEKFNFKVHLDETKSDFNDMGIMQAIDNITATLVIKAIIDDNDLEFDTNRILIYGHSHGAYLSYLCNAFAPQLFSMIIDNSAWLFPEYMKNERFMSYIVGKAQLICKVDYLAKSLVKDQVNIIIKMSHVCTFREPPCASNKTTMFIYGSHQLMTPSDYTNYFASCNPLRSRIEILPSMWMV